MNDDILQIGDVLEQRDSIIANILINIAESDALPRSVWDFNGNFIYVNKKFADILGRTQQEMIGTPFSDYIYHEDIDKSYEIYEENKKVGGLITFENFTNRYVHKDGHILVIHWLKGFNDNVAKIGSGQCVVEGREYNIK